MIRKIYPLLLVVAAMIAATAGVVLHDGDTLFRMQELDLFLYTPHFLQQQAAQAGGLLGYVGSYFTQFCYHPLTGALLLTGWAAVLALVTWGAFRVRATWAPVLLVPMALVLVASFSLGYWIYYLKLRGHLFSMPIGFTLAVALTWLYRVAGNRLRAVIIVMTPVVVYPLAGCYGLLATVLIAVVGWRTQGAAVPRGALAGAPARKVEGRWYAVSAVAALLMAVAVPLVCYRYVFCRTAIGDIWTAGLPLFAVGEVTYYARYLPYAAMAIVLVAMAAMTKAQMRPEKPGKPGKSGKTGKSGKSGKPLPGWAVAALHVAAVAAVAWGSWQLWYKDANFHRELAMADCVERCDWQGVLDTSFASDDEPTRMMVMYKNLAVFKSGRAGSDLYKYRDGSKAPATEIPVRMVQVGGKAVYLHYGVVNFCYRWCMEDGVEYGWRVEYLKQMLRCAVLNGEQALARKYAELLSHTRYYGDWAEHYLLLAGNADALAQDGELGSVVPLLDYDDHLASDRAFMETFLLSELSHRQSDHPLCTELSLMAAMLLKDIPTFWPAFFHYANTHQGQAMPRYFQEAALLYGNLEHQVDISRMPFDASVVECYKQFMQFAGQCQGMNEHQMRDAFYPSFGDTFFYNYYLFHDLTTN